MMHEVMRDLALTALLVAGACTTAQMPAPPPPAAPRAAEATSLLGKSLVAPPLPPDVARQREEQLAAARREYEKNPDAPDAIIWLGRRTAYLGRYRQAIDIFTEGIRKHPDDARMFRHRGHRSITVREFDLAIADLKRAEELQRGKPDQVEPDGLPNARNVPTTSLQSNIEYHLGLAYYLKGDFDHALDTYRRSLALANNPDRLVSTTYWMWMTLRRLGRRQEAEKLLEPIGSSMDVIEDVAYHKLLLMFAGDIAVEELAKQDATTVDGATILYGIGNWYFVEGQPEKARPVWQKVVDGNQWAAFGAIAAEAELARR